jgi:aspartyl protease family protein
VFPGQLSDGGWFYPVYGLGLFAVVARGLAFRRRPLGEMGRHLVIWAVVALGLGLGYAFHDDLLAAGARLRAELIPGYAAPSGAHAVTLTQSAGGAFEVMGEANGAPVRFVIDTGASDIVLSPEDARRLGVDLSALRFDHAYGTANGVGYGAAYTLASLSVGGLRLSNVPVSINQAPMGESLLGMAFLRRLSSYDFHGRTLVLNGPA